MDKDTFGKASLVGGPNDRYEEKAERRAARKTEIDELAQSLRVAEAKMKQLRVMEYPVGNRVWVENLFVAGQRAMAKVVSHPMDKIATLEIEVDWDGLPTRYLVDIERCHVC